MTPDTLPKLRFLDLRRMVREEPPPMPWVVEEFVVRGALTALVAKYGEGKSLLSASLAAGVESGAREAGLTCRRGPVVILDAENGEHEIHRRVRALGLPSEGIRIAEVDEGFDLRTDLELVEAVLAEHEPHLLVLDSFRSLWRGDENDSREVSAVLDPLRNLVRRYGAGGLLLHHSGKQGATYRGSSAIGASVELGFTLARASEDPDRDRRYLECWKCRPAPAPPKRWLRLSVDRGQVFVDEVEPFENEAEPERPAPRSNALSPRALSALQSGPLKLAELARAVGEDPKNRTVRRVLEALERDGEVIRLDGRWALPDCQNARTPIGNGTSGNVVEGTGGSSSVEGGGGDGLGDLSDEQPLPDPMAEANRAPTCRCDDPLFMADEHGDERCQWCGRARA